MRLRKLIPLLLLAAAVMPAAAGNPWDEAAQIVERIRVPKFPAREYNILHFGARKGGVDDARPAINSAITACSEAGGGRVFVPAGKYLVKGPVVLKSNVNLHLADGAELVFSADENDYLPAVLTRWEGTELFNFSPLIYAYQVENIAITGRGILNGQGSKNIATWKPNQKKDQKLIRKMGTEGTPVYQRVFGKGHVLRPAFIEPVGCRNILISDVKIVDATFWVIHPIGCNSVTVRDVTIDSRNPNNDGFDPESTTDALIERCNFSTGDDGIAIKSGRDQDGWRVGQPTENIVIRNCTFASLANGVCVGSEISGGVRNVYIENVTVPKAGSALYFKSNLDRGGYIENVYARNIKVDSVGSAIRFDPDYKSESKENYPTRFRNFHIENVDCRLASRNALEINGFAEMPVSDVTLRNVNVAKAPKAFEITHARNLELTGVTVNGKPVKAVLPEKSVSLNGVWQVSKSDSRPSAYTSKVPVPGVISMATPSLGDDLHGNSQADSVGYKYVWYRTTFRLNSPEYASALLKLRAKYNALVILNGKEIGYDAHSTYSHAEFDVTNAINYHGDNELVVRVGSWETASYPSQENSSEWWRNSRAPGIWDDVTVELGGNVGISHIKALPDLKNSLTKCDAEVANRGNVDMPLTVKASIMDGTRVVSTSTSTLTVGAGSVANASLAVPSGMLQKWSGGKEGNPKLYTVNVCVTDAEGNVLSDKSTTYGYRSIETRGRDVLINGEKAIFRAENIAFVRALTRWQDVMFDEAWIRSFIRSLVQDYNLNYMRVHLGHAYSKWYDIADEEGLMLQDEWRFMHDDDPTGDNLEQTATEFRRWIRQNVNHPSIMTWDQENEGHVRIEGLRAELAAYDPTRLWGEDSFYAKHIYDYSEQKAPVVVHEQASDRPSTVLESCRLWTNEHGLLEPREDYKTSRTASGWGVYYFDADIIGQLLADLHADIGTYYRSERIQAWAPFAVLSGWINGQNFFIGNIADSLHVQPNMELSLIRLNEPVGVSIDMLQCKEWYQQKALYNPKKSYTKRLLAWNDFGTDAAVTAGIDIKTLDGTTVGSTSAPLTVPAYKSAAVELQFTAPKAEGCYILEPYMVMADGSKVLGPQRRIMVGSKPDKKMEGFMAYGGRRTPVKGGESVVRNFLKTDAPAAVEKAIMKAAQGGLVDRLEYKDGAYTMQSTVYDTPDKFAVTTTVITPEGKVTSSERTEAVNYVDLPAPTRDIIAKLIGAVPVDESRIMVKRGEGFDTYDVRLNESAVRCKVSINHDGTIRDKKVTKNKKQK